MSLANINAVSKLLIFPQSSRLIVWRRVKSVVRAQVWKMPAVHEADSGEAGPTALRQLWRDSECASELQRSPVQRTPLSARRLRAPLLHDWH